MAESYFGQIPLGDIRVDEETVLCPRCRFNRYTPYGGDVDRRMVEKYPFPALSRTDNETHICAECGFAEATVGVTPQSEWPTFIPGSFGQGRTL